MSAVTRISLHLVAATLAAGCTGPSEPDGLAFAPNSETARYRVQFESRWSAVTHPIDFPSNAHFSRLVGGNHNASVTFWSEGQLASAGIRAMAEMGRITPLDAEITAAITNRTAESVFIGPALDRSPDTVTMDVTASQRFPLLTLVTMVAPSPDWFAGVAGLPLFENGQWTADRQVELVAWDAGTDSGQSFSSADEVTVPFAPIMRIVTSPLSPGGRVTPLGSFTFQRIQ